MKSNKHSRRQILLFLLFASAAFFYWFQDRWGIPFSIFRHIPEEPVVAVPVAAPKPDREEPVHIEEPIQKRSVIETFYFKDQESLKVWEQKVFKGKTEYRVLTENGAAYLKSESKNASSGLFIKTKHKATPDLWLNWKWRALQFPTKKDPNRLANRSEDDFVARVYVIFAAANIFRSDVIEYVWDESIAVGTHSESPYSDRIHLLVVKSGKSEDKPDGWDAQERNVYQDYRALFGKEPKLDIGMIAVMSDSDNTGTEASADFAEIGLFKDQAS